MMRTLLALATISIVSGCSHTARTSQLEVRAFDDPFAVDKTIPIYRAPRLAVLYVVNHIKRDDGILIGSHFVFVEPDRGSFGDGDGTDALDLGGAPVLKMPAGKKDREKILSVKWDDGFRKSGK